MKHFNARIRRVRFNVMVGMFGFWLSVGPSWALDKSDVLFYAPLDGTPDAQIARGSARPVRATGEMRFVKGHTGQGLLTGGPGSIDYATAGNVELDAGSIGVWVKPVDWQTGKNDGYMRMFVALSEAPFELEKGQGNFAWLYMFPGTSIYWLIQQANPFTKVYLAGADSQDVGGLVFRWEEGKWAHLLATWSGNQIVLYINGKPTNASYVPTPRILRKLGETFQLGGQNVRGKGTPDTVLDELIVLRTPVNPEEARLIYEKGIHAFDAPEVPTTPLVKFISSYLLSSSSVKFDLAIIGIRPDALSNWTCDYEIENAADPVKRMVGQFNLSSVRTLREFDIGAMPDGKYWTRVRLRQNGRQIVTGEGQFEKLPSPQWLGNTLGIEKAVPAPWTPINRESNTLSCWGRSYVWGNDALPVQITNQGRKLLARPVSMRAKVGGQDVTLNAPRLIWDRITPYRAEFTSVATLSDVPVFIRGTMEYDGFSWLDIELQGDDYARERILDSLSLEIPLVKEVVPLMHLREPVESGKSVPFHGKLAYPLFWFGDEKGGLQISARDFGDWQSKDRDNQVSLRFENGEAVFRFQFIDHPTRLARSLRYNIGFQATPVRPMPKGLRALELELAGIRSTRWMFFWSQWARIGNNPIGPFGYPVASENTMKDLDNWHKGGRVPWLYWLVDAVWRGDPVVKAMGGEWAGQAYGGDYEASDYLPNAKPMESLQINHDLASVRDYQVWSHYKLFKDNPKLAEGIRGVYQDMGTAVWRAYPSRDSSSTVDYAFTVRGMRELQKRFYLMMKKNWPHLLISSHISGDPHNMSEYAFADMVISGEHIGATPALVNEHNYHHVLNFNLLRAEYYAPKFGVPGIFLAECGQSGPEGIPASEHLCGLLWSHDLIPWPASFHILPFQLAAHAKEAFGWDDETQFHGYWEKAKLVNGKANQSPVVTSLFTRPGNVLFVVMNDSDVDAEVLLQPDWKGLGVSVPAQLIDAYARQRGRFPGEMEKGTDGQWKPLLPKAKPDDTSAFNVPVNAGIASFKVKARNFRALVVR